MATVDRMRATLHYKSERALSFMSFLQKLQYMFQLCAEQGEPLSNQAKIRELLAKCQSCQFMTNAIATLKFESQKGNLTFQAAINHLQTLVTETQTKNTSGRNISAYTTNQHGGYRQGTHVDHMQKEEEDTVEAEEGEEWWTPLTRLLKNGTSSHMRRRMQFVANEVEKVNKVESRLDSQVGTGGFKS